MNANTSTDDNPSDAQMAQALEWFRNAMNYLRTETYVHLTKAYIDAIEEALSSYQAPSVRTVSRDVGAGTPCADNRAKYTTYDEWRISTECTKLKANALLAEGRENTLKRAVKEYQEANVTLATELAEAKEHHQYALRALASAQSRHLPVQPNQEQTAGTSEPLAWLRMKDGAPDWSEDCLSATELHCLEDYADEDGYSAQPLYTHPPATPPSPELEQARAALAGCLTHSKRATDGDWAIISDPGHYDTMSTIIGGLRDDSRRYPVWELVVEVGGKQPVSAQEASTRLIVTAVNFVREHGPTILAALERAK